MLREAAAVLVGGWAPAPRLPPRREPGVVYAAEQPAGLARVKGLNRALGRGSRRRDVYLHLKTPKGSCPWKRAFRGGRRKAGTQSCEPEMLRFAVTGRGEGGPPGRHRAEENLP